MSPESIQLAKQSMCAAQQRSIEAVQRAGKVGVPYRTVRWLGMNWIGTPAPVRLWRWLWRKPYPRSGCGCVAQPKTMWNRAHTRLRDWCDEVCSGNPHFDPCAGVMRSMRCAVIGV